MTVSGESSGDTVVKIVPVELALTPTSPVSPNWTRNLALGLALGLLAGFGAVVLRQSLDRRVRVAADVEEIVGASALGVIPAAKELTVTPITVGASGEASEALRKLRTNLRFVGVDKPLQSMVVTSPNEGEGKSTIAAHLALLMAGSGRQTILVDADLRRPRVAKLFGVDDAVGLSEVLVSSVGLNDALISVGSRLKILPCGQLPPNPSELVGSDRMQSIIAALSKDAIVIIDAPPLLPVTDAGLLTAASDGALLVLQHGSTRKEQVELAARNVETVNGRILGFALNRVPKKELGTAVYGYGGKPHPEQR
jgi:capsular exopolysaccharide synthesis family protein